MTGAPAAELQGPATRIRLLHIATSLDLGGAQTMLFRLARALPPRFEQTVISLTGPGAFADRLRDIGIPTHVLGLRRSAPSPGALLQLHRLIRGAAPDVVQTWMYHGDLLGGLAARLALRREVIWGVHNTRLDRTRVTTRWVALACAKMSRVVPRRIVCVSAAARDAHVELGYDASRFVVIPNGFDVEEFHPAPNERSDARRELCAREDEVLIGLVARVDPQKDHDTFLVASRMLAARQPSARFVVCGDGAGPRDGAFAARVRRLGVAERTLLLGARPDMRRLYNAFDVATLSSASEAFPLVIGEAMACGVPCVVTDVGDCGALVGDTGLVVPPRDPAALAAAWEELIRQGAVGRRRLGEAARRRIEKHYGLGAVVERYVSLYENQAGAQPA